MVRILNLSLLTPELTISRILVTESPLSTLAGRAVLFGFERLIPGRGRLKEERLHCSSSHKLHSLSCWKDPRNLGVPLLIMWCVLCWQKKGVSCQEIRVPYELTTQTPRSSGEGQPFCMGGVIFPRISCRPFQLTPCLPETGPRFVPTMTTGCLVSNPLPLMSSSKKGGSESIELRLVNLE